MLCSAFGKDGFGSKRNLNPHPYPQISYFCERKVVCATQQPAVLAVGRLARAVDVPFTDAAKVRTPTNTRARVQRGRARVRRVSTAPGAGEQGRGIRNRETGGVGTRPVSSRVRGRAYASPARHSARAAPRVGVGPHTQCPRRAAPSSFGRAVNPITPCTRALGLHCRTRRRLLCHVSFAWRSRTHHMLVLNPARTACSRAT